VVHVATVHFVTDRWVDHQLRFLETYMGEPYAVHAVLNGAELKPHVHRFDTAVSRGGWIEHAEKLNFLAERIAENASDDDLLVFLDGDAFPIAQLSGPLRAMLADFALVAIRRDENLDSFPHPSFCATTVGFWRALGADWGHHEPGVSDVGMNLERQLAERGGRWKPLLRSNLTDLHPVLFGVYDDLIYHHGAGFRPNVPATRMDGYAFAHAHGGPEEDRATFAAERVAENRRLDAYVYERIAADDQFAAKLFLSKSG
jgi:hypothetical protein